MDRKFMLMLTVSVIAFYLIISKFQPTTSSSFNCIKLQVTKLWLFLDSFNYAFVLFCKHLFSKIRFALCSRYMYVIKV